MKNLINLINSQTTQDYHCVYREDFDDELFYLTKTLMKAIKILLSTLLTNNPVQINFEKKTKFKPGLRLFFIVIIKLGFLQLMYPKDLLCLKCNIHCNGEKY